MSTRTWRIILTSPTPGAWNMAVDEALLGSMGSEGAIPILRLFAWEPACLSLGYTQPAGDVDADKLAAYQWDLVRRPTGGRAILHTDELTYSVIAPLGEPVVIGNVLESYQRIAQALLLALQYLGLPARADKDYHNSSQPSGPVCFDVPSHYEITVNGKKLIGSAQARRKQGVLQHGTLPLYGDLTRITRCLVFPSEEMRTMAANSMLERATTVETVLGKTVQWSDAAQAFQNAFAKSLDIEFTEDQLSAAEKIRANELVAEKYGNPQWVLRS
jgi:lipoate-protein ligase A